jgi:hypothetical protein
MTAGGSYTRPVIWLTCGLMPRDSRQCRGLAVTPLDLLVETAGEAVDAEGVPTFGQWGLATQQG